jgi:hypothetical protein
MDGSPRERKRPGTRKNQVCERIHSHQQAGELSDAIVYPMTLMTIGLYNQPKAAYLPSVLY